MEMLVKRRPSVDGATIGELFIDGPFIAYTLEDQIREVPGEPVESWKVPGATAIPSGTYCVELQQSQKFGPDTLTVLAVPGYQYIRMHPGNSDEDTEGCLLLGMQVLGSRIVGGTSRPAVDLVKHFVKQALADDQDVSIEIVNP